MTKEFYYQIKGKEGKDSDMGYSYSNWSFPPIFSGKVLAENKKEAKKIIEEEYNKKFPLRVLSKDLDNNEFLLKITDMDTNPFLKELFIEKECKECKNKFRRIDLYNDANVRYKGIEYCSDSCKDKAYEKTKFEISDSMFNEAGNVPVIYKITNTKTNMCYIGQTVQSFTLRWWQHIKWGQSDCKFHKAMQNSKLTDWIFEVIDVPKSKEELNEKEAYYIKKFDSINKGYNTVKLITVDKSQTNLCDLK